jgi:hypothetical protein
MTNEQINIAIAEACGWEREFYDILDIPDYCNDLNAMHEAEEVLKLGLRNTYDAELGLIAKRDHCFIWETTARQRAEAFLRTFNR